VYVHTCMKMHCYFLLNVKHGASQLYLGGGGSNYLGPALSFCITIVYIFCPTEAARKSTITNWWQEKNPTLANVVSSGESKAELTGAQLRHVVAELRHL